MIEDGRAYGLAVAFQHLLRRLEAKGVLSYAETQAVLDDALEDLAAQTDVLSPAARADASRTVGLLYLPKR